MRRTAKRTKVMNAKAAALQLAPVFDGFAEATAAQVDDTRQIMSSLRELGAEKAVRDLENLIEGFNSDARRYRAKAEALRKSLTP